MTAAWQEFFKRNGEDSVPLRNYDMTDGVDVEDLYQHFKARMLAELAADPRSRAELLGPNPYVDPAQT